MSVISLTQDDVTYQISMFYLILLALSAASAVAFAVKPISAMLQVCFLPASNTASVAVRYATLAIDVVQFLLSEDIGGGSVMGSIVFVGWFTHCVC